MSSPPATVYRAAQLGRAELKQVVRQYGIRTVINLTGCCDPLPPYLDESRATAELNICQEDVGFSACRLPPVQAVRELVEVLDRCDYPVLFHCHRGIDRTGMASAVALLLHTDTSLAEAREQLGLRYGHWPFGKTAQWTTFSICIRTGSAAGRTPRKTSAAGPRPNTAPANAGPRSSGSIRRPGRCMPRPDRPFGFRVRCVNTSVKPWVLQPGDNAGVHLGWFVINDDQNYEAGEGRSGLFDAVVPPQGRVDLTVALPALSPGATTWTSTWWTSSTPGFTSGGHEAGDGGSGGPVKKKWRLLGSVVLVGVLAWRIDWAQAAGALAHAHWALWAAGLGVYLFAQAVSAVRWRMLARVQGFGGSQLRYLGYYFIGMFFNLMLPTSIGGDMLRTWYLATREGAALPAERRQAAAILSVTGDRLNGLVALIGVACVAVLCCPTPLPPWILWIVGGLTTAALVGLAAAAVGRPAAGRRGRACAGWRTGASLYVKDPRTLLSRHAAVVRGAGGQRAAGLSDGRGAGPARAAGLLRRAGAAGDVGVAVADQPQRHGPARAGHRGAAAPVRRQRRPRPSRFAVLTFAVYTAASLPGSAVLLLGRFPRFEEVRPDDDAVGGDSDQGRTRQPPAAA